MALRPLPGLLSAYLGVLCGQSHLLFSVPPCLRGERLRKFEFVLDFGFRVSDLFFTYYLCAFALKISLYTPPNALKPPSIGMTVPVTKADAGLISHSAVPMGSAGSPKRPMGVCAMMV